MRKRHWAFIGWFKYNSQIHPESIDIWYRQLARNNRRRKRMRRHG